MSADARRRDVAFVDVDRDDITAPVGQSAGELSVAAADVERPLCRRLKPRQEQAVEVRVVVPPFLRHHHAARIGAVSERPKAPGSLRAGER